jgi:hypothetical protein
MIAVELVIVLVIALIACCVVFAGAAIQSLNRFERLYTMQMQTMIEIIYAIAEMRGYEEDDPTDEEEHSRPELAPVIPFRGGPDGKPDDPA